jgi:hypothetical protein
MTSQGFFSVGNFTDKGNIQDKHKLCQIIFSWGEKIIFSVSRLTLAYDRKAGKGFRSSATFGVAGTTCFVADVEIAFKRDLRPIDPVSAYLSQKTRNRAA